ncbi:MAG: site-2 protease family protein [Candidatus Nealsonbacteria bacterium]|nr:site-2 protease family protein [Candidatus Nealsonbacteria bacterium]
MEMIFLVIILIFSIVIHEVAHGAMANHLGDPTAKYAGRLTLNPIKHLDPVGSVLVPLFLIIMQSPFLFGWARPVPVNPYNFSDQKYGSAKVAMAGPGANLLVAIIIGFFSRFLPLGEGVRFNIIKAFLERDMETLSYLLQGDPFAQIFLIFSFVIFINILLAIFNLLPIPPLDGSHILFTFLPDSMENLKILLNQYGFFILIAFIFLGGFRLIFPLILEIFSLITGLLLI